MYFWTCWYTRRFRLAIYLLLGVVFVAMATVPAGMINPGGHWVFAKVTSPAQARIIWDEGVDHTIAVLLVLVLFAAADLGALATGEDAKRREIVFLVTRPRPRRHFIWTSWAAGIVQLIPLLGAPLLLSFTILLRMTHTVFASQLAVRGLEIFALAAAMYALAFSLSVLTRSPQSGFQLAAFVILVYAGIDYARSAPWFFFDWGHSAYYGAFALFDAGSQVFPFANIAFLAIATFALPIIADVGFRRQDL